MDWGNATVSDAEPMKQETRSRQRRMAVLAQADGHALKALWKDLGIDPECRMVRGPETGLVVLRGRIDSGGSPFNFGEATVTRATVRLGSGEIGHAIMLGSDRTKARLAAVIDALSQDGEMERRIEEAVIAPLGTAIEAEDATRKAETAATRVVFFTLVRGED